MFSLLVFPENFRRWDEWKRDMWPIVNGLKIKGTGD